MNAHIRYTDHDVVYQVGKRFGALSIDQVKECHFEVFRVHNLSHRRHGGTFLVGRAWVPKAFYCGGCDPSSKASIDAIAY